MLLGTLESLMGMEGPKLQPTVQTIFIGSPNNCFRQVKHIIHRRHIVRRPEYTEGDVEGALREVPPYS